jgi:hypothetical protein
MNEVIELVAQKVGLTLEQSQQAVEIVVDYLKEQHPILKVVLDDLRKGAEPKQSTGEVSKAQTEGSTPDDLIGSVGDILGSVGDDKDN